jgi:hypothetical protein
MIWGGFVGNDAQFSESDDGALYDPRHDSWSLVSHQGAPNAHGAAAIVWTGKRVLVWGGFDASLGEPGGSFDPNANVWEQLPASPSNIEPSQPLGVWTGTYFLILNGDLGIRYDPGTGQWSTISSPSRPFSDGSSAVWTGSTWILWGGPDGQGLSNTGAEYDPVANEWTQLPLTEAPSRQYPVATWTGKQMVIWGGTNPEGNLINTNVIYAYDPSTRQWSTHIADGPPEFGFGFPTVTTDQAVLIWNGYASADQPAPFGHALAWAGWSFSPLSIVNQPSPRVHHSATWTGREMIIWGGSISTQYFADGGRYTP